MQEDKNVKKKGFLKGMKAELKKVIWPTGKQTMKSTFVTIAFALLISLILIVLNLIFNALNKWWISSISGENTVINSAVSGDNVVENIQNLETSGEEASTNEVISGEIVSGE